MKINNGYNLGGGGNDLNGPFGILDTEPSSAVKETEQPGRFSFISHTVDHRFSNVNSDYVPSSII